jgi:hypothetical protein
MFRAVAITATVIYSPGGYKAAQLRRLWYIDRPRFGGAFSMAIFTREELLRLLEPHSAPCVSILMPTHRHHPGAEQDPIRFKNLLKTAEGFLSKQYSSAEVRTLLDPLAELATPRFWQYPMDGLALFCSPDLLAEYRIPMRLPELAVVAESFHVKPLIRFLQAN